MKILIVVYDCGGGIARGIVNLRHEWAKLHDVTIALSYASHSTFRLEGRTVELKIPASDSSRLRKIYGAMTRSVRLMKLFRDECPNLIISFGENANFSAIIAAASTGYLDRLRVSMQGRIEDSAFAFVYRALLPWMYRFPSRVIAASKGLERMLISRGVPAGKILVCPNATPICKTDVRVTERESVSPLPNRYLLGAGRLARQKRFERLLKAFSDLDREDLHLAIIGEGEKRQLLTDLARKLGIGERVHFPGFVADVDTWYRHAECFVLSSDNEGWPNVLMEAMANGCPVVSFDCKYGPSEIIEDGKSGLLIKEGDVAGLTRAIARVLDSETLRRNLAIEGMKRVKKFNFEEIAARWLRA